MTKLSTLDTDTGDVISHRFMEIPITGPGSANRLVCITGIAVRAYDTGDNWETLELFDFYIKTDYRLHDQDQFTNIVDGNTELLSATYMAMANISADDSTDVVFGLDNVEAQIDTNRRVQIHVNGSILGDATYNEVTYHVNILIKKAL